MELTKSKKRFSTSLLEIILFILLLHLFSSHSLAQKTVKKENYWDVFNTKIERIWFELGNGVQHGLETNYDESGKVWLIRQFDNGKMIKATTFYQDDPK